ncbi:tyrosine recombinase XerC [Candidatus Symbiobacter mobilis]|uniref:Tyrosine recombinase XerC n=1 Tax=Candidatus Symbiobacter mobilis CR TaxID=946483 RepID=U5N6A9_9BURK|nr:tyrosine recombinase XerC [Candidatus Symbiobacter mobilis]AGX87061.1 recombinase XerC [Candidatus Symbiobacter mobilis CR]
MAPTDPLLLRYLDHVRFEKRLAARSVSLYAFDLARLQKLADEAGIALPTLERTQARKWMAQLHAQGKNGKTIALTLSVWRGFYTWLGRLGEIRANPIADLRAPKSARPLPKALGVDDAVGLADFHDDDADPWLEARDAAIVALLYGGGLRVGELCALDAHASPTAKGWIDIDAGEARVTGKGSKKRIVPIGAKAVTAMRAWMAVRAEHGTITDAEALFVGSRGTRLTTHSVWQRLRQRSQRAGVSTPVHPHMLRHSCASHVLQSSGDLRGVQELLGHANIGTTQVYTRLDTGHLAKVYDAAHPRARLRPEQKK